MGNAALRPAGVYFVRRLMFDHMPSPPVRSDYPIGVIGAGFIVRDIQLVAYRKAGFKVEAIYAEPPEQAEEVAELRGIPKAYTTREQLLADPGIQILDIAVPPHVQPEIIADALRERKHIRGILAQKPLAVNYREALEVVRRRATRRRSRWPSTRTCATTSRSGR